MAPRSQPYRVESPLDVRQAENIDEMFQILFDDVRNGSIFPLEDEGDILYFHDGFADNLPIGVANRVLRSNGTDPLWGQVDLTLDVTGVLPPTNGGTGFASYAVGDILYASTTTALAKLADVSVGSYLRSGGVNTAPLWSTVKLPNTATTGDLWYGSASNTISALAAGTLSFVLTAQGAGVAPVWAAASGGGSGGITGLLTNGDPANPELIFDSNGDIITVT